MLVRGEMFFKRWRIVRPLPAKLDPNADGQRRIISMFEVIKAMPHIWVVVSLILVMVGGVVMYLVYNTKRNKALLKRRALGLPRPLD